MTRRKALREACREDDLPGGCLDRRAISCLRVAKKVWAIHVRTMRTTGQQEDFVQAVCKMLLCTDVGAVDRTRVDGFGVATYRCLASLIECVVFRDNAECVPRIHVTCSQVRCGGNRPVRQVAAGTGMSDSQSTHQMGRQG